MIKDAIDIIVRYSKSPKLYIAIFVFCVVAFLLWPFIYANFLYHSRMHSRVEILSMLSEIDYERLSENEILLNEYYAILEELELQRVRLISGGIIGPLTPISNIIIDNEPLDRLWKFLSGGSLAWVLALIVPFMNTFSKQRDKPLAFILLLFFGFLLGVVGMNIPTLFNQWFNLIGFPILQIAVIVIMVAASNRKKKSSTNDETIVQQG